MMKTRRKSKAAAAIDSDNEQEGHDEPLLTLSIPDDIDLDLLSDLLPETNLTSPSSDEIFGLYRLLLIQSSEGRTIFLELEEARAEIEKKEVELDQALQDRESLSRELEASLENVQEDLKKVKKERDELAASQNTLQDKINSLTNSQSSSSAEVDTLKHRVEDTEREKRDLVGVISRLKQEGTQQEDEIKTLRANLKEARQEHQALEVQVRELRSTETSSKFKLESLTQQLQLSQAEVDRTNAELASKAEEFSKYRRTKHSELANVQASYDSLTQTHASTQATLKALQSAHTAQTHQATQALEKVQSLTSQLAVQEAAYANEASGLRKLVEMMEEREKNAKHVVETIEREWSEIGEKAEGREAALRDEVERERKGREIVEKRAEQMEGLLERMRRGELPIPGHGTPGTPLRAPGTPDIMIDGIIGLSPTVAMASKAQRSGKTFTEVYSDYVRLQDEYARKSAEYDHMDRTLSSVLAQIEERAPILSQQRAEYERLQSEASQLAAQLAQALSDRDNQTNLAQDNAQKLSKSVRENELLQKQLADLGRQVQSLLREISRRDDPTIPSDEDLESVPVAPAEDTETIITNNLVLFKSVNGLQEQNQKLLKIVRELGRKMESEEKDYKEAMEREQGEAVREAHEAIQDLAAQLERQKKSSEGVIQAYMKERDALRAMLARAEKAGAATGANTSYAGEHALAGVAQTDAARELAEMQSQFEAYRMEMGIDSGKLRDDLAAAQREIGQLGASLAKTNARYEFLNDRHRMSQDQLAMQARELDDLSKRNQQLFDQWSRVDIECTHATEELQIATGRIEQLRNECANLRAEKKIWESVQNRLIEENKTVALERSHLSDLMGNVQKMHNDLERSGENDRRRLEGQLHMLENQTQDLRTQLSQERDSVRHISLQKDIELKELQARLDKAAQEFSKTRESLVGAETSKKHLEERVEDLTRQLQGNEEKLSVYERRPGAASGSTHTTDDMSREQQLEAEVAELRSTLKVTEVDLASARSHVQQFKEISQANEEALASLHTTYDEYKASTEAQIARHESEYKALQEKLQSAQDELAQLTSKYNELQKQLEDERTTWTNDKKTLEDTIVDMSTSEKHSESDRASRESEVRQQEERAKAAEEKYSSEVIAHAESIKAIEVLKRDLATVQKAARDNLTNAETAQIKLATSEGSWKQQKEALDKEVVSLNARCEDLKSQNALLHQHLESVSSQANRIKVAATSTAAEGEGDSSGDEEAKLSELRAVVTYLRKEKEIVDLQLELSKQETARLKAQIDHLTQSLDETRTTLSEERERAVETAASAAQHAELLERINQLNILRESNATLRADCESYAKKARDLETKLQQVSQELDPAKEQARIAQAELEASKSQLQRQQEENRRWQERNSQLLSKYDRIDPAEVQALRDEIELFKSQKVEIEQQKVEIEKTVTEKQGLITTQETRIAGLEEALRRHKENIARNNNHFKTKMGEFNSQRSKFGEEKRTLEAQVATLEQTNSALRADAGKAIAPIENVNDQSAIITALQVERDALLAEKSSWATTAPITSDATPVSDDIKRLWDAEKAELIKTRDDALTKLKTAAAETQKAVEEGKEFKRASDKFQARLTAMMKAKAAEEDRQAAAAGAAKTSGESTNANAPQPAELLRKHAEELRSVEAKLAAKHQQELKAAVEAARKEATEAAQKAAAEAARSEKPSTNIEPNQEAAVSAAVAETVEKLKAKHAEEVATAMARGKDEGMAKAKLKDSLLVRAQKKVKDLEAQIVEWRAAGLLPQLPTPTKPAAATTAPTPSSSTAANPPAAPAASSGTSATTNPAVNATLPRKPPTSTPTGPAQVGVGAGRGGATTRGRAIQRAMGGVGGGVGLGRAAPTKPSIAPEGGMSIMGAAGKRPRESEAPDDSLAKRLKPADPGVKPPVTLRRPAPGPAP